ncbi:hypothetical protein ES703_80608 [subsurface metagenome]
MFRMDKIQRNKYLRSLSLIITILLIGLVLTEVLSWVVATFLWALCMITIFALVFDWISFPRR